MGTSDMCKQVWILNHYAQDPGSAGGIRHFSLAERLQRHGWCATVIAASIESQTGRQRLATDETTRYELIRDVPFLWIRTPTYHGNGIRRMANMLSYTGRVLLSSTTGRLPAPHVVIGSSVHPFAAAAGLLLARRYKVPFIFEVRDLWPQTLIDMGRMRAGSYAARLLGKLELWLYRNAARIIILMPLAAEYIKPLGVQKDKIIWIPNGADLSLFGGRTAPESTDRENFTIMYFGAHGQANGLDTLLHSMQIVQSRAPGLPIRLRMIGDGPQKARLIQLAHELALTNVCFEPSVPKAQIPTISSEADAFVVTLRNLPELYKYGISLNKIFDYMAAARPIIIASNAVNNPVREAGAGFTVPAEDPERLATAILQMATVSPWERKRMGLAGRAHVEKHYSFEALGERLATVLHETCAENSARSH